MQASLEDEKLFSEDTKFWTGSGAAKPPGQVVPGKLGCCVEGAGKRRVFAIGHSINQTLSVAKVLKRIPMDGTDNQTQPLEY